MEVVAPGDAASQRTPRGRLTLRVARVAAIVIGACLAIDGFAIEPFAIEVTRHRVTANVTSPLRIAHLTDLHTDGPGRREREVLEILDREKPDVIAVTGDTVDGGSLEVARPFFARLRAPLGIWVVRGNWENWRSPGDEAGFYRSTGATFLLNEGRLARPDVFIGGLDDSMSGHSNMAQAFRDAPAGVFRLALFHSPEAFDGAAGRFDLALAGHTHGGQVRVPWLGAPWLPPGSGRYVQGWYTGTNTRMYVSRGVGTSILPVRLFCRPEVAIVTIVPTE